MRNANLALTMSGVQSIERAFALLRALAFEPGGITELSQRVELPKSTVARLLSALEHEGAVSRAQDGTEYRLGSELSDLFERNEQTVLLRVARPFLVGLSAETGETTGLDVLHDGWVHFVDQVEADNDVQVRDWTGESGRAHSLPAGIVMLAHLSAAHVDTYISQGLDPLTPHTVTDADELRNRLQQARSSGYAWGYGEFALGINSVAAPVFDRSGVIGALRVHGPSFRFPDPNHTHDIGRMLADAAARLTEQLDGQVHLS